MSENDYIPPFTVLSKWMDNNALAGTTRLTPPYDDVLDVLKAFLRPVSVDDDWYRAEYPAVADYLLRSPLETPRSHFRKHGYFEGRKPFARGWRSLIEPTPFASLKTHLRMIPTHGRLRVDIERADLIEIIKRLLITVQLDEFWYRATYPKAARAIDKKAFPSTVDHYADQGYFDGYAPYVIAVDEEWYVSRYEHVRTGLKLGHAKSAQDHFMRLGYQEGCRPTPP